MKRLIGEKMKAYGENSGSRWARNRQIAYDSAFEVQGSANCCSSLHRLDPQNVDHLFMRFYVEGENGKATVRLEMTKVLSLFLEEESDSDFRESMNMNINIDFCL
jgi:hypothetical protein